MGVLRDAVGADQFERRNAHLSAAAAPQVDAYACREIEERGIDGGALADVFTDLLDPSLVPLTAFGFIEGGRGRYLGFVRSRIRDATERPVPVTDYIAWTGTVAHELADRNRRRHGVFGRYAQVVGRLPPNEAVPVSVLLEFSKDTFIDAQEDQTAAAQVADNEIRTMTTSART